MGVIMGLWTKLFGSGNARTPSEFDGKPAIYGGDGSSIESAIVVNCASVEMEKSVIRQYISERHGEEGTHWTFGIRAALSPPKDRPDRYYRRFEIELSDGKKAGYTFDCTRSHRGIQALLK